ncbi:GNAT family N-acetyltransferase [Microbacterium hydrocarbonoxydans]|uniref:GNAT family N-acetyltransferase n=1 Tax=Microbacterium hydrocarbonoxydans TaxID=273678 RepID=UPI00203BD398|nr:GNAT family N-acetyltransferase [Microbacterium hydrocarbonoxydans]MCM3779028.1 GNAT family N-acetyltransferase [Microbacterium hydrocarbonoxydans]
MSIVLTEDATLHPLVLPARADATNAGEFRELARVRNDVYRAITGRDEQDLEPEALLPLLRSRPERTTIVWAVRVAGEMVGRAVVDVPHEEGSRTAIASIEIHPRVWGRGIGSAVLPHIESVARQHGRTVIQNWTEQPASSGERITARTGHGSVPDDHVSRFLLRHGFSLEQVYRVSRLDLDGPAAGRSTALHDDAVRAAAGYRVLQWEVPTPPEHLDGYAWLKSRMSTDAPSAGLEADEERWDAERVVAGEKRIAEMRQRMLVTVAQHVDSGELAAFTEIGIGPDMTATTHQHDTLVLREHRGHRLGQLVKCAALATWREIAPQSRTVITYNAEENRPMLSINEALGFDAIAYEGAWRKDLS